MSIQPIEIQLVHHVMNAIVHIIAFSTYNSFNIKRFSSRLSDSMLHPWTSAVEEEKINLICNLLIFTDRPVKGLIWFTTCIFEVEADQ